MIHTVSLKDVHGLTAPVGAALKKTSVWTRLQGGFLMEARFSYFNEEPYALSIKDDSCTFFR